MERENLNWRRMSPGNMKREEAEKILNWREPRPGNVEQQWEEAEKILTWREMSPGVYKHHGIEYRGENDYGRPISVITLETKEGVKMYYAPSSLYWNLKNHRSETNFVKYEGTQASEKGYEYPVLKFAK